jgi:HK97 family phage major capsid protein
MSGLHLKQIEERKLEIRELLSSNTPLSIEQLEDIDNELQSMSEQRENIISQMNTINPLNFISVKNNDVNERSQNMQTIEETYRDAFFKVMQGKDLDETEKRTFQNAIEQRSFNTDTAAAVIPTTTHEQVMRKLRQNTSLFPNITVMNLPGKVKIPVEVNESGATWVNELDAIPESGNQIGYISLDGHTLAKLIPVSIATESMSIDGFESYLVDIIADKMSIEIEKSILNGSGSGQPTGILSGVTWTEDENLHTFTNLSYNVMLKPFSLLGTEYLINSSWVMNSKTLYEGVASLLTSNGESIFIENTNEGFAGRLLGRPVILNDYMPDDKILFGDFKYYFMNFSQPIQFEKSSQSGFRKAVIDYRSVAVLDGKPGMNEAFVLLEKE